MTEIESLCADCGVNTTPEIGPWEWYMVKDKVWKVARMPRKGFLCIGCLESRLARRLHHEDFMDAPVNMINFGHKSARLISRLSYGAQP